MAPLTLAIDASRTTVPRVTGTEHYARRLIAALLKAGPQHCFTLYFRDPPQPGLFPDYDYTNQKIIPFRRAWTHIRFAAEIWRDRAGSMSADRAISLALEYDDLLFGYMTPAEAEEAVFALAGAGNNCSTTSC